MSHDADEYLDIFTQFYPGTPENLLLIPETPQECLKLTPEFRKRFAVQECPPESGGRGFWEESQLPWETEEFDCILIQNLHRFTHLSGICRELFRVLRISGVILVEDWDCESDEDRKKMGKEFGNPLWFRSRSEILSELEQVGFRLVQNYILEDKEDQKIFISSYEDNINFGSD